MPEWFQRLNRALVFGAWLPRSPNQLYTNEDNVNRATSKSIDMNSFSVAIAVFADGIATR